MNSLLAGINNIVVYLNKCDIADKDMIELAEIETREIMNDLGFNGENAPVIAGSALAALEGVQPELGRNSIEKLLNTLDEYVPSPPKELDKPFFLPIEHVYSIPGRGTVVSGRLMRGTLKKGFEVELLGFGKTLRSSIGGLEMFRKTLDGNYLVNQNAKLTRILPL